MPNLLSTLSFAGLDLRNRIVMPPMWSGQASAEGHVTDANVEYHAQRAAAGCALVIVEHTFVHPRGRHSPTQLGIHDDSLVTGLSRLAGAIRQEGAVACLQLSHAGSRGYSAFIGETPVAPSPIKHPYEANGEVPEALSREGISEVVDAFGSAALRVRQAGFDAVEIHAAHGFLLSEFLSPLTNIRQDSYGGSEENRMRIHLEIVAEIRRRTGSGFPVFVRLGAHDETPGGLTLDMSSRAAVALVAAGVCMIDVSGGLQGSRGASRESGYFVSYAEAIRSRINVPAMVTGGIRDPLLADRIVREGRADLVGIGRAMLEDSDWARKAAKIIRSGTA